MSWLKNIPFITSLSGIRNLWIIVLSGLLLPWVTSSQSIPDSLANQIPEPQDFTTKVNFLNQKAWDYKSSQPLVALELAEIAYEIADEANFKAGLGNALHTQGMIKWYIGAYEDASTFFFEALKIREGLNDSIGLARSYNNIGNVYYRQENDSLALAYYKKALTIREELKDTAGLIYSYNNVGDVLARRGDDKGSLNNYGKALDIAIDNKNLKGQAFIATHLGEFYQRKGLYQQATQYYMRALGISENQKDDYQTAINLNMIAEIDLLLNQPEAAIPVLERSIELSKQTENNLILSKATENISNAYAQLEDYKKAFEYRLIHQEYATELFGMDKEKAIYEVQTKYDLEKQKRFKDKQLLQQAEELSRLTRILLIFALVTFAVLFLLGLSRFRFQLRMNKLLKEKNTKIERQNKTLIQTNTSLEQFAYIASHDLKEPLRTIGAYSSLIQRDYKDKLDEDADEYLTFIVNGVKQMHALLEDVLLYSRADGEADMKKESVDMNKILGLVEDGLQKIIQQKKVSIVSGFLPSIWANPFQMHQVLQNLISNGIKFNEQENIEVEVSCKEKYGEYVFSIRDNGIGIPDKHQKQIFNLFQRLDNRKYTGTGLGLAICKKIVNNHEGEIWVKSTEGIGSTFYFSIPKDFKNKQTKATAFLAE